MIVESLKPTPVSVTMPMMMPTVAAAAPTLIAYLAPTTRASRMSKKRALPPVSRSTNHADAMIEAAMIGPRPSHSVRIPSRMQNAIAAAKAIATNGLRLVSPRTMQPVMPQNAARYGVKSENSTIRSTASGIAVGQLRRMTSRATGNSERGRPRRPYFLASK